jgi:hypothetical protein
VTRKKEFPGLHHGGVEGWLRDDGRADPGIVHALTRRVPYYIASQQRIALNGRMSRAALASTFWSACIGMPARERQRQHKLASLLPRQSRMSQTGASGHSLPEMALAYLSH